MTLVVREAAAAPRRQRQRPDAIVLIALALGLAAAAAALLADILSPFDPAATDLRNRLLPPAFAGGMPEHILGTDQLGRDVYSRLLHGLRISLAVGVIGTLIGAALGSLLGFVAAHYRGIVDDLLMALADFQTAMPFIVFALAVLAFFGNDLVLFLIVVGIDGWERYARIARGLVLSAQGQPYFLAARALGVGDLAVYARHVLPVVASVLVVQLTVNLPGTILLESSLSFLGLGIQPPLVSLGLMLGQGRDYLVNAPWVAVSAGVAVFIVALSVGIVGDYLRDRLDPHSDGHRRRS